MDEKVTSYDSLIRWNKRDSVRLSKAINRFNRELSKIENKENIPPKVKYDEIRDKIVTRRELDTIIRSLDRASVSNLEATRELASGEKVSEWLYQDTIRRKNQASINLLSELNSINRDRATTGNRYMGEERISEIQTTLDILNESLDDLDSFNRSKKLVQNLGRTDFNTYKNKIFMQNVKTALREGASNFTHYKEFMSRLNQIRNPNKFYEYVKKSPAIMDIFLWYKSEDGSLVYSAFDTNEQAFDNALKNDFDIDIEVD